MSNPILWDEAASDLRADLDRAKARRREFRNAGNLEMVDRMSDEIGWLRVQLWDVSGHRYLDEFVADAAYGRMG